MRADQTFRTLVAALVLGLSLAFAPAPAMAQNNNFNPTANAVKEEALLNALKPGNAQQLDGRVSIPDEKSATLIRPAGREWREFHQGTMHIIGIIVMLGMLALLTVFYLVRGRIRISAGPSGQTLTRFGAFERFMHWMTSSCFIILALSGINVTFGRSLILPVIGPEAFTTLSIGAKFAHNYLAFPFMGGILLMLVVWIKDNIPDATDLRWFAAGGGIIGNDHPPAKRFNGGQKVIFWSVMLGGAALSVSGLYLLFPYAAGGVLNLQFWNVVHGLVSVVLVAIMIAHVYIGSIGMEGAFDAMGSGEVDLNWAKEHHSLWVKDELAKGVVPTRGMQPAE
jgi:formate dehydrogenase subunit gamma